MVVDDEPETLKYVCTNLRVRSYDALAAENGKTALKLFDQSFVDLIIPDIMMPGADGFEVCQTLRRRSDVPIIMLSARGQEKDIVRALNLGADDYLTKPFGVEEMLASVRATLRRAAQTGGAPRPPLIMEDLTIDFSRRQVTVRGSAVRLTPTEFNLQAHLAINAGRVLTHRALLESVWGPEYGEEREYLWAYVRRLHRTIEQDPRDPLYILTWPGVGYSFAAPP